MPRQRHWKAAALARQVEQAISLCLMGEFDDEVLQSLSVVSVKEAADPGAMDVLLSAPEGSNLINALAKVLRVQGVLRNEVARAIHRKKTPRLNFALVPEQALRTMNEYAALRCSDAG